MDIYVLRVIFSFLPEESRNTIYKTCRFYRSQYLWVNPTDSFKKCLEFKNRKLANSIWDFCYLTGYMKVDRDFFQYCCKYDHSIAVSQFLLDSRIDPSAVNNYAIRCASSNGHLAVIERLLQDHRVDPSAENNYAIRLASLNGHLAVVERLLQDLRVDPSAEDNYAIRLASQNGQFSVVERLLQDPRVDPSADNNYVIRWASYNGHLSVVERLLQDPRVNLKNK